MKELSLIEIAQRQVCEVEILYFPDGLVGGIATDALPEESQFESEAMALGRLQISRVIPPFRLKIWMIEMIAWEFVAVSRQRSAILRR